LKIRIPKPKARSRSKVNPTKLVTRPRKAVI
jgi:hypothetical protein